MQCFGIDEHGVASCIQYVCIPVTAVQPIVGVMCVACSCSNAAACLWAVVGFAPLPSRSLFLDASGYHHDVHRTLLPYLLLSTGCVFACVATSYAAGCVSGCYRWLEVGGRSTENVLQELLAELDKTQHEGGCGDSGRLDKETQRALKQYVPTLKLFCDDARVERTLEWVRQSVATRRLQQPVH